MPIQGGSSAVDAAAGTGSSGRAARSKMNGRRPALSGALVAVASMALATACKPHRVAQQGEPDYRPPALDAFGLPGAGPGSPGAPGSRDPDQPAGPIDGSVDGAGRSDVGGPKPPASQIGDTGSASMPEPDAGVAATTDTHPSTPACTPPPALGGQGVTVEGTPNLVFVTSTTYRGDLGGLQAADARCRERARAANLRGTFVALLSSSTVDARTRLGTARGWVRTDGRPFADTQDDLLLRPHLLAAEAG